VESVLSETNHQKKDEAALLQMIQVRTSRGFVGDGGSANQYRPVGKKEQVSSSAVLKRTTGRSVVMPPTRASAATMNLSTSQPAEQRSVQLQTSSSTSSSRMKRRGLKNKSIFFIFNRYTRFLKMSLHYSFALVLPSSVYMIDGAIAMASGAGGAEQTAEIETTRVDVERVVLIGEAGRSRGSRRNATAPMDFKPLVRWEGRDKTADVVFRWQARAEDFVRAATSPLRALYRVLGGLLHEESDVVVESGTGTPGKDGSTAGIEKRDGGADEADAGSNPLFFTQLASDVEERARPPSRARGAVAAGGEKKTASKDRDRKDSGVSSSVTVVDTTIRTIGTGDVAHSVSNPGPQHVQNHAPRLAPASQVDGSSHSEPPPSNTPQAAAHRQRQSQVGEKVERPEQLDAVAMSSAGSIHAMARDGSAPSTSADTRSEVAKDAFSSLGSPAIRSPSSHLQQKQSQKQQSASFLEHEAQKASSASSSQLSTAQQKHETAAKGHFVHAATTAEQAASSVFFQTPSPNMQQPATRQQRQAQNVGEKLAEQTQQLGALSSSGRNTNSGGADGDVSGSASTNKDVKGMESTSSFLEQSYGHLLLGEQTSSPSDGAGRAASASSSSGIGSQPQTTSGLQKHTANAEKQTAGGRSQSSAAQLLLASPVFTGEGRQEIEVEHPTSGGKGGSVRTADASRASSVLSTRTRAEAEAAAKAKCIPEGQKCGVDAEESRGYTPRIDCCRPDMDPVYCQIWTDGSNSVDGGNNKMFGWLPIRFPSNPFRKQPEPQETPWTCRRIAVDPRDDHTRRGAAISPTIAAASPRPEQLRAERDPSLGELALDGYKASQEYDLRQQQNNMWGGIMQSGINAAAGNQQQDGQEDTSAGDGEEQSSSSSEDTGDVEQSSSLAEKRLSKVDQHKQQE